MNDDDFDTLVRTGGQEYRAGREPDLDRLWAGIEERAFRSPRRFRPLALAASLIVGIGMGWFGARLTPPSPVPEARPAPVDPAMIQARVGPNPFVGLARDYFQQTTALLVALAGDLRAGRVEPGTTTRAKELLSTTRLLLDGNQADAGVQELLEDLELVLAQVVRVPEARSAGTDTELIAEAMDRRDVLSRLTTIISDREAAP